MIEAVFFDLYETLITEFDPNWHADKGTPAALLGIDPALFDTEWSARRQRRMTSRFAYSSVLREICAAAGKAAADIDEQVVADLEARRSRLKAAPFKYVEQPVLDALRRLRTLGVKLGLISNAAVEEAAPWHTSPFAPLFDDAVFSNEVGYVKPDPAIYGVACKRLSVVPARALFVGDGGSQELTGAAAAGLAPLWATWFLERWPAWRRASVAPAAREFPELGTLDALVRCVSARCGRDS